MWDLLLSRHVIDRPSRDPLLALSSFSGALISPSLVLDLDLDRSLPPLSLSLHYFAPQFCSIFFEELKRDIFQCLPRRKP